MPIYTSVSNQVYIGYPILKEREDAQNMHEMDRYYTTIVVAKNVQGNVFIVNKYDDLKQKLCLTAAEWDWLGKNREEINQLWHSQAGEGNGLYYENCSNKTLYIKLTTYQVKHGSKKITKLNICRFYKKKSGLAFMSQYHIRMSRFEWDQLMQDYDEINNYFLCEHGREVQEWNSQQALSYKNEENPSQQSSSSSSSSRALPLPIPLSPSSMLQPLYIDEQQLNQQKRQPQQKQSLTTEPTSACGRKVCIFFPSYHHYHHYNMFPHYK